jgi:hypothetical protein
MKKHFFMAAAMLLAALTSCTNENELTVVENNAELATAPVTVRVNDFSITTEEMPSGGGTKRAAVDPASYEYVKAIDLVLFASDGSEAYRHTQLKDDGSTFTTFGEFSFTIPVGNYTLVAVARNVGNDDVFTLTSPTEAAYTSEKPRETFCKTQAVTVTGSSPLDLDVTLNRISSWLTVLSTDVRPASATKIRTTFEKGGKSFNPSTGLALTDAGFTQVNNPSTAVGATVSVTSLPFLYTDEETMDVTIAVLDDGNNVLFTHTVNNVPFKRNYKTKLRGAIFTASASAAAFKIETAWTEYDPIDF